MNPKKFVHNIPYSVQPPYLPVTPFKGGEECRINVK